MATVTDTDIVTRLAREAGATGDGHELSGDALHRFAALVAEECAKVCEVEGTDPPADSIDYSDGFIHGVNDCADAIRAKFKEVPR